MKTFKEFLNESKLNRGKWFYDVKKDKFIEVGSNQMSTDNHSWKIYNNPELFRLSKKEVEEIKNKYYKGSDKFDYMPELIFKALQQGFVRITDVLNRAGNRTIEGVSEKEVRKAIKKMTDDGVHLFDVSVAIRNGKKLDDGIVRRLKDEFQIDDFIKGGLRKVKECFLEIPEKILKIINESVRNSFDLDSEIILEYIKENIDLQENVYYSLNDMITFEYVENKLKII